jgi:pilus assembly protein CpaF
MVEQRNLSESMAVFLKAAAASRLNILVSGGTGSGKTTLLNAMSKLIDSKERIITIEDAAELQLQQPHVLTMESRTANLEGQGEVTIRDLMINSLRMRPDRIILGEVRGAECLDMLQAMNTGHDGSMCTLHANRPREALTRMENMATMSGLNYPLSAIRTQIAEAIDLIVQIARMRDGMRRIVSITEVVGMEGDVVVVQEIFSYRYLSDDDNGRMQGVFEFSGLRPHCHEKFREFGHERAVMEALK